MRFEVGGSVNVEAAGAAAARVKVQSFIGTKVWAPFQVDIVADGIVMTGEPDQVEPLVGIDVGSRGHRPWRAYPLVDHVADKVCAILERHQGRPSTRFKDLIDLVAIAQRSRIPAPLQMQALAKEADRRKLVLPQAFDVPDHQLWARGYSAEASRTVGLEARDLDQALSLVRFFLDPLLAGAAKGEWDPGAQAWNPERR
jgi:hypothetical protein